MSFTLISTKELGNHTQEYVLISIFIKNTHFGWKRGSSAKIWGIHTPFQKSFGFKEINHLPRKLGVFIPKVYQAASQSHKEIYFNQYFDKKAISFWRRGGVYAEM